MAAVTDPAADLGRLGLPLRSSELFGDERLLEVEVGVGKGAFLLAWARLHPETGLLGVERISKYHALASLRAVRQGVANVRLVHTTAEDLLFRCLAPGSLAGVHVYFPDPWPKKRHHKRRFFKPANVARVAEVLAPGGMLRVKTDHDAYAAVIADVLAGEDALEAADVEAAFAEIPLSGFESKYIREGRTIHRFALVRKKGRGWAP